MCSKDTKDLNEFKQSFVNFKRQNNDTNFLPTIDEHLKILKKYSAKRKEGVKGAQAFRDREAYQKYCASFIFYINYQQLVFQKKDAFMQENGCKDYYVPPLEAFHYSNDEKEMHKNRIMASLKKEDVLHLRIIDDEHNRYKLEIVNKYGDERRMVDFSLHAILIKNNEFEKDIIPPLKVSDYIRAAVFGNVKQEQGVFKNLMVTLNPNYVNDKELKCLKLGRVYKKDIPNFPEDLSNYSCLGKYLEANNKYETAKQAAQHISALQCDPGKTGPFYNCMNKKQAPKSPDGSSKEEIQSLSIFSNKSKKAKDLLSQGDLQKALLDVEEALGLYPEDDKALTLRGKIYLALAGGKPSSKVKKAMMDFVAALTMNPCNKEAAVFHDLIVMGSINRYSQNNMVEKAEVLRGCLKCPNQLSDESAAAFMESIKVNKTDTLASAVASVEIKEEPMEIQ